MGTNYTILLDTNFLINLLGGTERTFHKNASYYYERFLKSSNTLKVSTISVAEYCAGETAKVEDILYKSFKILPFTIFHAERAGQFAKIVYKYRKETDQKIKPRRVIADDTKLFAQADIDKSITHFLTAGKTCRKIFNLLGDYTTLNFKFIDLTQDPKLFFGKTSELPF